MMVQIVEFKGEEIEFPDNMADADIEAVLIRETSSPEATTEQPQPTRNRRITAQDAENREENINVLREQAKQEGSVLARDIPEIGDSPELNQLSLSSFLASAGALFTLGDEEVGKIISSQFPEADVKKDLEGNLVVKMPSGGTFAINKPGFSPQDSAKLGANIPAFALGSGFASGVTQGTNLLTRGGAQALAGGATQAVIEGGQSAIGGEVNPGEIALSAGLGGASEVALPIVKAVARPVAGFFRSGGGDDAIEQIAEGAIKKHKFLQREGKPRTRSAQFSVKSQPVPEDQAVGEIRKLLEKGDTAKIVDRAMPDADVLRAADELGMDINPSAFSTDVEFQKAVQALKSQPGSKISAQEATDFQNISQRADDLVEKIGQPDRSLLDFEIKETIKGTIKDLEDQADDAYRVVREEAKKIGPRIKVKPRASVQFIDDLMKSVDDDLTVLTGAEKRLLKFRDKNPTYAALDMLRKEIGNGFKGKGVFKDESEGRLKQVYRVILEDQQGFADVMGFGEQFAKGRNLVSQRKPIEKQAMELFGKELEGSIIQKLRSAAGKISKGDISSFNKLMQALPESKRSEAAGTIIGDMFTTGSARSREGVRGGFVDAGTTLNKNKLAKDAIFSYLPKEARKRFDNIHTVSKALFNAKKLENASKTARDVLFAVDDGSLIKGLYAQGKSAAKAEVATAGLSGGAAAAGAIGASLLKTKTPFTQSADALLTSQEFKRSVVAAMNGNLKASNSILNRSPAYKRYLKHLSKIDQDSILKSGFINWLKQEQEE